MKSDLQFFSKALNNPRSLRLLFRASQHNFKTEAFHLNCDEYQNTLTLIRTEYGKTIGGYTHYKWLNDDKMDSGG